MSVRKSSSMIDTVSVEMAPRVASPVTLLSRTRNCSVISGMESFVSGTENDFWFSPMAKTRFVVTAP